MYICSVCGKTYENRYKFLGHCSSHRRGETYKRSKKVKKEKIHKCKFCGEKFEKGVQLGGHTVSCLKNPKRFLWYNKTVHGLKSRNYKHSDDVKRRISENREINKGGRCKWYPYLKLNGDLIYLQGTYEVRFAKILDFIDDSWIKPTNKYPYFLEWVDEKNKKHRYIPDFWSPKYGVYFEIKGKFWSRDQIKMKAVLEQNKNTKIFILYEKDLIFLENLGIEQVRSLRWFEAPEKPVRPR